MMRLLNVHTLTLEVFNYPPYPPYAALSHVWGKEEITFQDIQDLQRASKMAGFAKLKLTCRMAAAQQLSYAWVDTCCIDKSSSAELSEAINSMYQWYRSASECIVYLDDLPSSANLDHLDGRLQSCRWFTRGWTLQELLAPRTVVFYNQGWDLVGEKKSDTLLSNISKITGIHRDILLNPDLVHTTSLAVRMSWAADRATTMPEDIAYCLLGLFNVNMPLLYGEGVRAFRRLQEELIKIPNDLSVFAWLDEHELYGYHGMLAPSPNAFRNFRSKLFGDKPFSSEREYYITNKGLSITAKLFQSPLESAIFMSLKEDGNSGNQVGILLQDLSGIHVRIRAHRLFKMVSGSWNARFETIHVWLGNDNSTSLLSPPDLRPLGPKLKDSPYEGSDILCVDSDRSPWDTVSLGPLSPCCIEAEMGVEMWNTSPPSVAQLQNIVSAKLSCCFNHAKCMAYNKTSRPANSGKAMDIAALHWYDETGKKGPGPVCQAGIENKTSPCGTESFVVNVDAYHQDSQPVDGVHPFASFRGIILGIAVKRFEDSKTRWLPELSNGYGFDSWGTASFACPFTKLNPIEYMSCLKTTRPRTGSDLVDHLDSTHRQPLYCPICTTAFQHISIRDDHIRERTCKHESFVQPPGISIEERHYIRSLLQKDLKRPLTREAWYRVWDMLFPQLPRPNFPFIDRRIEIMMSALQFYWMNYGSNLIADFLISRGELAWQVPNEERALARLRSDILSDLMDRYLLSFLDNAGPGEPQEACGYFS